MKLSSRPNSLFMNLISVCVVCVSLILLLIISSTSIEKSYSSFTFSFENSTHFQISADQPIDLKPSVHIIMSLTKDPEGFSSFGELYRPFPKVVQISYNDEGKFKSYSYNLTNSGTNDVTVSDTRIYPTFAYKIPAGANTTTESIQRFSQSFDVETIERLVDGIRYIGFTDSPLVVNDTAWLLPMAIFTQYNEDSATVSISSQNPPVRNDPELLSNLMQMLE